MLPLIRKSVLVRNPAYDNAWTYARQWLCFGHSQSGLSCYFDLPDSKQLTENEALQVAMHLRLEEQADRSLLTLWFSSIMN